MPTKLYIGRSNFAPQQLMGVSIMDHTLWWPDIERQIKGIQGVQVTIHQKISSVTSHLPPWNWPPSVAEEQNYLPMYSLVGMSIKGAKICTWHDLETLQLSVKTALSDFIPFTQYRMYICTYIWTLLVYIFRCLVQFATFGPWNNLMWPKEAWSEKKEQWTETDDIKVILYSILYL